MLFSKLNISIALVGQLLFLCDARLLDLSNVRVIPGNLYKETENALHVDGLDKRAGGGDTASCFVCGIHSCGSGSCSAGKKRDLDRDFEPFNATEEEDGVPVKHLYKRRLPDVTEGEIEDYVKQQNAIGNRNKDLCPMWEGVPITQQPTFCTQQAFSLMRPSLNSNGQWVAGTYPTALSGCTVLMLVSARAVYACHIWEDAHYYRYPPGYQPEPGARLNAGFDKVINLFRGEGDTTYAAGSSINFELFNKEKDQTTAFIMTPRNRDTPEDLDSQQYGAEYKAMVDYLKRNIPRLSVIKYNYNSYRVDNEKVYRGQALFEWDPNAHGEGQADWRIWFEHLSFEGRNMVLNA